MDSIIAVKKDHRLVVLVPEYLKNIPAFAHKICWMAIRDHADVLYLALTEREDAALSASRSMAILRAVTQDRGINVGVQVSMACNWLTTLRAIRRPGDVVVCHEEQVVKTGPFERVSADAYLRGALKLPVATVAGFYHPGRARTGRWLHNLLFWIGFVVILGVFAVIEVNLNALAQGVARSLLMMVVFLVEVGAVLAWLRNSS
jgi:hypothetical protein